MTEQPVDSALSRDGVSRDALFSALADGHRRQILWHFETEADVVVSVDDLVDHVLEQDGLSDDRDRIALTLHHRSLPTLVDAGLLDYDVRSQTVRYRGISPLLSEVLSLVTDMETAAGHSCGGNPSR